MGFGVSLLAALCARVAPSRRYSFGLGRSEALGALVSLASLWLLSAQLFLEALVRCQAWWRGEALDIDGRTMFLVCIITLLPLMPPTTIIFHYLP
jgi:Co/Zn/Cd efflux system component